MPSIHILTDCLEDFNSTPERPFAPTNYSVLAGLLSQAGIEKPDYTISPVFPQLAPGNKTDNFFTATKITGAPGLPPLAPGKYLEPRFARHLRELQSRLEAERPKVILALGNIPLWALGRRSGIKKLRGSPLLTYDGAFKVLATWHPSSILRQWNLRPIVFMDICKLKAESASAALVRPRRIIHIEPSLADIEEFYHRYIAHSPFLSTDIETKSGTITEIGFAPSEDRCLVIPFWSRTQPDGNYWRTAEDEREAWRWVDRICREKKQIGQNFQYDMQYLSRTVGIPCPGFIGDTMLLHHTLQPELEKGLGFLGSIYTSEPSWKFMRTDHSTLKREDD